jgi:hypothetical protein
MNDGDGDRVGLTKLGETDGDKLAKPEGLTATPDPVGEG